jgi:hypothetical protein
MSRVDSKEGFTIGGARLIMLASGAALAFSGAQLSAGAEPNKPHSAETATHHTLADLEKAFWVCDHAATVYGMLDVGTAGVCAVATRDLRLRKFNDDFIAMLNWWQRNKARQHQLLDMRHRAVEHR